MRDDERRPASTSARAPSLDAEALLRAERMTALEALFQAFSGGTPEKLRAYVLAAEKLDPRDLAIATVRLIERWTKTTIPAFAVIRETCLEIAGERISKGERRSMTSEQVRALIYRRLEALREGQPYGTAGRVNPTECWIEAHWEQFREAFAWPAYEAQR